MKIKVGEEDEAPKPKGASKRAPKGPSKDISIRIKVHALFFSFPSQEQTIFPDRAPLTKDEIRTEVASARQSKPNSDFDALLNGKKSLVDLQAGDRLNIK